MTNSATITFARTDVLPPVYVVTALSDPPWEALEMEVEESQAASADLTFSKTFQNAAEGSYQYKIRIGEHDWVVDELKENATDEHGNCNNVVHVKPTSRSFAAKREYSCEDRTEMPQTFQAAAATSTAEKADRAIYDGDVASNLTTAQVMVHDMEKIDARTRNSIPLDGATSKPVSTGSSLMKETSSEAPKHHLLRDQDKSSRQIMVSQDDGSGESQSEILDSNVLPHEVSSGDLLVGGPHAITAFSDENSLISESQTANGEKDELARVPRFSLEDNTSISNKSNASTDGNRSGFTRDLDPQNGELFDGSSDEDHRGNEYDEAPLLPHERASIMPSSHGSTTSVEELSHSLSEASTFRFETSETVDLFGGSVRTGIFRARTSSLPYALPRSDAEDEDLRDTSLERFPVNREQILERVATIGRQMPEDHPIDEYPHSLELSVPSQACSSVDLAPSQSYASLASVLEAGDSDEEDDLDLESIPSPIFIGVSRRVDVLPSTGVSTQDTKWNDDMTGARTTSMTDSKSIDTVDGPSNTSTGPNIINEGIATPSSSLKQMTPPPTPGYRTFEVKAGIASFGTLPLVDQFEGVEASDEQTFRSCTRNQSRQSSNTGSTSMTSKSAQSFANDSSFFMKLIEVTLGPLNSFIRACTRASATILTFVLALVTYILFGQRTSQLVKKKQ